MTLHLWPRRLATRTAVVVLVGLALVQIAGLTIHALDRIDIQRLSQARNIAVRVVGLYRLVATTTPAGRDAVLVDMRRGPILDAITGQASASTSSTSCGRKWRLAGPSAAPGAARPMALPPTGTARRNSIA